MTFEEAEKIIGSFHDSIRDLRPEAIVQPSGVLRYSQGRIKYAHFVYAENLLILDALTKKSAELLIESYGLIDSLFVDVGGVESINTMYREYIAGLKNGVITDFSMPNLMGEYRATFEFENFLDEYLWRAGKAKLYEVKEENSPQMSRSHLVYFLSKELREKKDSVGLLKLANGQISLNIIFPGRKSPEEINLL